MYVAVLVYEKTMIYLPPKPSRIEKSRHFVYARALITRKVLHSKDAQCNTKESPILVPRALVSFGHVIGEITSFVCYHCQYDVLSVCHL